MSKYIRTKEYGVCKVINEDEHTLSYENRYVCGCLWKDDYKDQIQYTETIEELCDEFDIIVKGKHHHYYNMEQVNWVIDQIKEERVYINGETIEKVDAIYGAIWTDKGLIYVAKINNKGELELL